MAKLMPLIAIPYPMNDDDAKLELIDNKNVGFEIEKDGDKYTATFAEYARKYDKEFYEKYRLLIEGKQDAG